MIKMVEFDEGVWVPEECCTMTNPLTSGGESIPDDVEMPCEGSESCTGDCGNCIIQIIMNEYALYTGQVTDQVAGLMDITPISDAIEELNSWHCCPVADETYAAAQMGIKALKKQIPMKVCEIHVDEYICPNCLEENGCNDAEVSDEYCPKCGQRLISYDVIKPHEEQALKNHCGQTLDRLAARGGLSWAEAYAVLTDSKIPYGDKYISDEFYEKKVKEIVSNALVN